ncbi:MAG: aldose 1-epimerase family protein [Tyzzerella sp.]|uniref:Aldose 1-epimerase family protein n=1 Tax=Candidatus Fimicola merdigallinarum TaxID=2840819 RepID=A0A9D9DVV7_9FIRM|nr:aldose 1-epimerase family protein [Candidatus Fimicola merdigallinarum]
MSDYIIDNGIIKIGANLRGGELKEIIKGEKSYLWTSDPSVWGYSSPVLFPFVGLMNDQKYTYKGKEYEVLQHGFARTSQFELLDKTDDSISFIFKENEETLKRYPFKFNLICGYKLEGNKVTVSWQVKNTNDFDMPFFIGAHPAFMYPNGENSTGCFLHFEGVDSITCRDMSPKGHVYETVSKYQLENSNLEVTENLLNGNTLILENNQVKSISLLSPEKEPYIKVDFNAPVVGIWSKNGSDNIFVCIEPWYGRCDSVTANEELGKKDWINVIKSGETFEASYTIEVF